MYNTKEEDGIWEKMILADKKNYMLAGGVSANS